jgi:hypothetical protein
MVVQVLHLDPELSIVIVWRCLHLRYGGGDRILRFAEVMQYPRAIHCHVSKARNSLPNGIELSRLASPRIHSNARIDAGLAQIGSSELLGSLKIQTTE